MNESASLDGKFKLAFFVNTAFMLFELSVGLLSGSLILIADAAHNLTDSITLAISWLGNRYAKRPADNNHTLGHGRVSVLTAFINSTILAAIALVIFVEALHRFSHPTELRGATISIVAVVGIIANGLVASLFRKNKTDLNAKAAYANMAFDTVFSIVALIAGILLSITHQSWIDPIASIGVGIGLLYAAINILRQATHIFLEGVPLGMDINTIRNEIQNIENVSSVDELYAWSISSEEYIFCCSITPKNNDLNSIRASKNKINKLLNKMGFSKTMVQIT